ncbi:alpha/beta hydrolase [uncultured Nisaea sp.]|jgi:non-heme chloroperoxidase|uniref:alpha/beta fold hydrolase n=1 Tax=uncultured Nisaea sp. TaxID=538215 RepID=UPI0030EEBDED|tara:strand:- start:466 stop:1422 length:957 start_codon:yes stop_codon:yes gene_type:complete
MNPIPQGLHLSRRQALIAGGLSGLGLAFLSRAAAATAFAKIGDITMTTFTTTDGVDIFFKDWGKGQPIVFSHGWPLSSDAWDAQMLFFGLNGYRVIAHDRRGHGRSAQPWDNNNMDRYADDLAELIEHLDLRDVILIGHSTGGGEVSHYIGRHGNDRVAKVVLVGAVPPLMLKTADNPNGTPLEVFDGIREGTALNRSQFFQDLTVPFYGFNRDGVAEVQGLRDSFWLQGMAGSIKGQYDSIREFSEVDYTADLKAIRRPTLIVHGSDDQIVPIEASAHRAAEIVQGAELKIYEGSGHGLAQLQAAQFNTDVLDFIRA